jgi:hypothetical protein
VGWAPHSVSESQALPFTAAHPLAVVPLVWWRRLDPTCLVIGTMAPDFEYFARMKQASAISHTWLGLLVWNIPVTLLLAFAFHYLVKHPLILVAPRFLGRRLAGPARHPWPAAWTLPVALTCVLSAAIGATTHLLWDGVTHSDGMIASRVHALRTVVDVPYFGPLVLHRVLQHASTAIGCLALAVICTRVIWKLPPVELPAQPRLWPRVIAVACIGAGLGLSALRLYRRPWMIDDVGQVAVILIAGLLAGVLLASGLLWRTARGQS